MHPHYTHAPKHLSLNHLASINALETLEEYRMVRDSTKGT